MSTLDQQVAQQPADGSSSAPQAFDPRLAFGGLVLGALMVLGLWVLELTLEQNLQRALLEPYDFALAELDGRIELSSGVGVELEDSAGLNRELYRSFEIMRRLHGVAASREQGVAVLFVNKQGRVVDTAPIQLSARSAETYAASVLASSVTTRSLGEYVQRSEVGDVYLISRSVHAEDHEPVGHLIAVVPKAGLGAVSEHFSASSAHVRVIVLGTGISILLMLGLMAYRRKRRNVGSQRGALLVAVLFLSAVHGGFVLLISPEFRMSIRDCTYRGAEAVLAQAASDLERITKRGFKIETLKFDRLAWSTTAHQLRGFVDLRVVTSDDRILYSIAQGAADKADGRDASSRDDGAIDNATWVDQDIDESCCEKLTRVSGDTEPRYRLELLLRHVAAEPHLTSILRELLSSVLVLGTLFTEAILVALAVLARTGLNRAPRAPVTTHARTRSDSCLLIRPLVFLLLLGIDLSMSFIPLHMERIYDDSLGLSRNLLMGLPISAEFLFVGIALLISGFWIDRRGWHLPLASGVGIALLGSLWSWLASDPFQFIASRGLVGFGYGVALMASQSFVVDNTDEHRRAGGLAHLFAGLYGGSLAGGVAGALLAEYLGFRSVFFLSALIVGLAGVYALLLPRWLASASDGALSHASGQSGRATDAGTAAGLRELIDFVSDRRVLALVFFTSLPASLTAIGFINYFSPIYLRDVGVGQAAVGQILMIYGLCMVFIGPLVSNRIVRDDHKRFAVLFGSVLGAAAFLLFTVTSGALAVSLAMLLLGIAHSLVLSSQSALLLGFPVSQALGRAKALGLFRASSRIGQMLGPVAFGAAQLTGAVDISMALVGGVYAVCALLFWMLSFDPRRTRTHPLGPRTVPS